MYSVGTALLNHNKTSGAERSSQKKTKPKKNLNAIASHRSPFCPLSMNEKLLREKIVSPKMDICAGAVGSRVQGRAYSSSPVEKAKDYREWY
jgi:hypothetical protein